MTNPLTKRSYLPQTIASIILLICVIFQCYDTCIMPGLIFGLLALAAILSEKRERDIQREVRRRIGIGEYTNWIGTNWTPIWSFIFLVLAIFHMSLFDTNNHESPYAMTLCAVTISFCLLHVIASEKFIVNFAYGESRITALMLACERDDAQLMDCLLSAGVRINARDKYGKTALMHAIDTGQLNIARGPLLIRDGELSMSGPMWYSYKAYPGRELSDVVKLLLDNGAKCNVFDENNNTPLMIASCYGYTRIIKLLLSHGVDIDATAAFDQTSLFFAAGNGNFDAVVLLVESGASINIRNQLGFTPLFSASLVGNYDIAKFLIERNVDVNACDNDGRTSLMLAASYNSVEVVKLLLDCGAKLDAQSSDGSTALSFARARGHQEVVQLLNDHGV